MQKQKTYNIADSNIALLGSDLNKKVREAAAATENAWKDAGKAPGLQIWRIEKFKVVAVAKDTYGTFYSGDSYIVLNTYKKVGGDALAWDVHFWLGTYTTQDEAGTAAYKTVELDDFLGGAPVQHREVQGFESEMFLGYFKNQIRLLEGGVESGFRHVKPEEYKPRLLQLKGKKKVRVTQVDLIPGSLNSGDVFILDNGLSVIQWNGSKSSMQERTTGSTLARAIKDERKGLAKVEVNEEGTEDDGFWKCLGGKGPVKSAEEGGTDDDANSKMPEKKLFRLSDATGKMEFTEISSGSNVKMSQLDSDDVFILDNGAEVFAWIGKGSTAEEKKAALGYAQEYLKKYNRPAHLPISRLLEGAENGVFKASF